MSYTCPAEFKNLYHVYTGSHEKGADTIGNALTNKISSTASPPGPLIIVNNSHMMVYDNEGKLLASCDYRANDSNGFYEMTAVSHVGPALMSLALLREGGVEINKYLESLKKYLQEVRVLNKVPLNNEKTPHWLDQLDLSAWEPWKSDIRNMIDYACQTADAYIEKVTASENPIELNFNTLQEHLFDSTSHTQNIGYNNVMVSTFILTALEGVYNTHEALQFMTATQWRGARVIIQSFPGEVMHFYLDENGKVNPKLKENVGYGSRQYLYGNLTSGLTPYTNFWVPLLKALSKKNATAKNGYHLPDNRIFIVPYATMLETPDGPPSKMPTFEWEYYAKTVWNGLYYRGKVASEAMANYHFPEDCAIQKRGYQSIDSDTIVDNGLWPGDYGLGSVNDFMKRIKHSFSDVREMLSNSVGFWVGSAFAENGFQIKGLHIPGLSEVDYPKLDS